MPKKTTPSTPITSTRHADKRTNIPTEELRDFIADEERAPKTLLYPRDPSLDPQLVWKGKDEQDRQPLEVPAVPIYIQEKISPQAIIENVRQAAKQSQPDQQLSFFADFNNITFEDLVDFYHHEQNWTNRMILGDSLLVMTSLAEKEGLKGKVQMIYLDPPYGIKFGSNWQVSTKKRDVKDGKDEDLTRQPEQIKAFRDTWELGIHSYLAYLRDRFHVCLDLLTDTGSIFVQIGDENIHLVRCVMDEIFGSENFMGLIFVAKTSGFGQTISLASVGDYIIWYAKKKESCKYRQLYTDKGDSSSLAKDYKYALLPNGESRDLTSAEISGNIPLSEDEQRFGLTATTAQGGTVNGAFPVKFRGKSFQITGDQHWKTSERGMNHLITAGRIHARQNSLRYIRFLNDFPAAPITNNWIDLRWGFDAGEKRYVVETNPGIITRCLLMTTDPGDLVLDPTCGSGTTAYVAEQWGRRWITIDTSRVAVALARTRLMAGRFPYYLLSDSPEGSRRDAELSGQVPPVGSAPAGYDVRRGFVYKRVPHITLKSIANNEEIDLIHEQWQAQLEALRLELDRLTGQAWEDWQIPREVDPKWPPEAAAVYAEWWSLRRLRQQQIDASIAKRADTELLYDQPYEDGKKIRVSGPFTVESLSPHRVLSTDAERPLSEQEGQGMDGRGSGFETLIIDNLRAAGVQNTKKGERLKFTRLEPHSNVWLHATGEYQEKDQTKRVAVCIGPEHGTVGPDLIKDAAKEAVQGLGFDLLVVLGFAFDPHVSEEVHRYGKLTILPARINPDLQMGSLLLKNTGAGNLFMVFGEPDVEINHLPDGKLSVTIKGVDIYDPTTGEIRSSSTDDIACWFVDTDYNQESFFVRHAYFTGAGDPYDKLRRALRAEIDEAAWSALYTTTSYPFDRPARGRIAVKVINHYGDEVLKVYSLD